MIRLTQKQKENAVKQIEAAVANKLDLEGYYNMYKNQYGCSYWWFNIEPIEGGLRMSPKPNFGYPEPMDYNLRADTPAHVFMGIAHHRVVREFCLNDGSVFNTQWDISDATMPDYKPWEVFTD
jgi:hypothetical protein